MKSIITSMIITAGLLIAGSAFADEALLKKSNCMSCHKMEGKLIGPGFVEIANKYKGDSGAAAKLEASVIKGSTGVWGTMAMPPMANLNAADVKTMATFILSKAK